MRIGNRHGDYWRRNLRLTGMLLAVWFAVSFVAGWYARELQSVVIFGFPLPFYIAAQGALLVYVVLVGYYAYCMNRLDREFGAREGGE